MYDSHRSAEQTCYLYGCMVSIAQLSNPAKLKAFHDSRRSIKRIMLERSARTVCIPQLSGHGHPEVKMHLRLALLGM
jgi:hypothetical protein